MFEDEDKTGAAEIYLCLFHNVGCGFDQLKSLEVKNEDASAETGQIFWIPDQAADGQKSVSTKVQAATADCVKLYDSVIAYSDKFYSSPENVIVKLKPIGLYEELSFTDLDLEVGAALKMTDSQYGPTL